INLTKKPTFSFWILHLHLWQMLPFFMKNSIRITTRTMKKTMSKRKQMKIVFFRNTHCKTSLLKISHFQRMQYIPMKIPHHLY
ncbi:hypothetical protein HDU77_001191, partial [Chytriomyces hyalinus]